MLALPSKYLTANQKQGPTLSCHVIEWTPPPSCLSIQKWGGLIPSHRLIGEIYETKS